MKIKRCVVPCPGFSSKHASWNFSHFSYAKNVTLYIWGNIKYKNYILSQVINTFLWHILPFLTCLGYTLNLAISQIVSQAKEIGKWTIFFFVKSWAIVPRGASKKKIWLGTFFKSVLTIFISFSRSVIVFSGLVIDTADSYMLQQFHNCLHVSEK